MAQPESRILLRFVATKCLCAPHLPVGEEGRSFLDDDGHLTGQDEGRVCDINTTRVRLFSLAPLFVKGRRDRTFQYMTQMQVAHQADHLFRL